MIFFLSDDLEDVPLCVWHGGGINNLAQGLCPVGQSCFISTANSAYRSLGTNTIGLCLEARERSVCHGHYRLCLR